MAMSQVFNQSRELGQDFTRHVAMPPIPHDQPRGVVVPVVNNGVSRYMGSLVDVVQPPPVAMVSLGQYRLASVTELANVSS